MTPIGELVNNFLNYKYDLEGGSIRTLEAYKQDLTRQFLPYLDKLGINHISEVSRENVEEFLVQIRKSSRSNSLANRNRKLACIKSLLTYLSDRGIDFDKEILRIKVARNNTKTISYLNDTEKVHLLQTVEQCATPFYKDRDIAILNLFLGSGIRVSELINLKIQDIELNTEAVSYITIKRKGGSQAKLPINGRVANIVKAYLSTRKEINTNAFVFVSRTNKPLDPNAVYHLVRKNLEKANIHKNKKGPHMLRHTVGVSLRRQGTDIATIGGLLGHKRLETTGIYLNVELEDLRKAVKLL